MSILFLFGFSGLVTRQILGLNDFSIYGFRGVVLSPDLHLRPDRPPVAARCRSLAQPDAGGCRAQHRRHPLWRTFWKVTFPLSLPGIASAFLVVFIRSMADFGSPLWYGRHRL